jgi:Mor family transcriptional regulator
MSRPSLPKVAAALEESAAKAERGEAWGDSLAQIAALCSDELHAADSHLDAAEARRIGCRLAIRLGRELGGSAFYWPRGARYERRALHLQIYSEHDGTVHGPHGKSVLRDFRNRR